mgnify:CR=1 FL=1
MRLEFDYWTIQNTCTSNKEHTHSQDIIMKQAIVSTNEDKAFNTKVLQSMELLAKVYMAKMLK